MSNVAKKQTESDNFLAESADETKESRKSRFFHPLPSTLYQRGSDRRLPDFVEDWSRHAVRVPLVHDFQLFRFLDLVGNTCNYRVSLFLAFCAEVRSFDHRFSPSGDEPYYGGDWVVAL